LGPSNDPVQKSEPLRISSVYARQNTASIKSSLQPQIKININDCLKQNRGITLVTQHVKLASGDSKIGNQQCGYLSVMPGMNVHYS